MLQAEVAAENVLLELEGLEAIPAYDHEMMLVIDEGGKEAKEDDKKSGGRHGLVPGNPR